MDTKYLLPDLETNSLFSKNNDVVLLTSKFFENKDIARN